MFTHAQFSKDAAERTRRVMSDYLGASQTPGNGYRSVLSGTDYLASTSSYSLGRYRACRC